MWMIDVASDGGVLDVSSDWLGHPGRGLRRDRPYAAGGAAVPGPWMPCATVSGRLWGVGGRTRAVPVRSRLGHGTAKCSARWPSTCTGPCTGEHTRSISGPDPDPAPRLFDSRTPYDLGFCGAPGRIRTCGHRIRSPVLYPLSYGCLIQLSPAVAGCDHVVARGGRGRCITEAGRCRRWCLRSGVPCRGACGVSGRHSRVLARSRPQAGKASSTTVIRSCFSLPRAFHQIGRYGPPAPRYR